MRALQLEAFGLDGLRLVERATPEPGPGEALVRLRAAALNSRDLQVVHDQYAPPQRLPIVPGSDAAGEVMSVGEGVERVRPGDRVCPTVAQTWLRGDCLATHFPSMLGGERDGVLCDEAVFDAEGLVRVPDHLSWEQAATLPAASVTAWQALVVEGALRCGQTVLVQGTGGVSLAALQIARACGARVIATSSSDAKLERLRALGAWAAVDRRAEPDWPARVRELTGGRGVDHVVDVVGDLGAALACLRTGGLISQIGYLGALRIGDPQPMRLEADTLAFVLANARLHGVTLGPRDSFEELVRAVEVNRIEPVVDRVFGLPEAVDALHHLRSGGHVGKVVVAL